MHSIMFGNQELSSCSLSTFCNVAGPGCMPRSMECTTRNTGLFSSPVKAKELVYEKKGEARNVVQFLAQLKDCNHKYIARISHASTLASTERIGSVLITRAVMNRTWCQTRDPSRQAMAPGYSVSPSRQHRSVGHTTFGGHPYI